MGLYIRISTYDCVSVHAVVPYEHMHLQYRRRAVAVLQNRAFQFEDSGQFLASPLRLITSLWFREQMPDHKFTAFKGVPIGEGQIPSGNLQSTISAKEVNREVLQSTGQPSV